MAASEFSPAQLPFQDRPKPPQRATFNLALRTRRKAAPCSTVRLSRVTYIHTLHFFFFFFFSINRKKIVVTLSYFYKPSHFIRSSFFPSFYISPQATNVSSKKEMSNPTKPGCKILILSSIYYLWTKWQRSYFSKNPSAPQ